MILYRPSGLLFRAILYMDIEVLEEQLYEVLSFFLKCLRVFWQSLWVRYGYYTHSSRPFL